jgi:manganese efflux pump family protein
VTLETVETLLVAVALGCDAFAVGLGVGTRFCSLRQVFRLSFHFGLFQFFMPLLGCFIGQNVAGLAREWAPWVAFGLLFFIGAKMIHESLQPGQSMRSADCPDPTRGLSLIALSLATSMDALGVGFSLGVLGQGLLFSALIIGIVACSMTWIAMKLGNRLSKKFGQRMEIAGGLVLIAIAVKLLVS